MMEKNTERKNMKKEVEPIEKFDDEGNLIYFRDKTGYEEWWSWDEKTRTTKIKTSTGYVSEAVEDERGNVIKFTNNRGYEEISEYDENDNLINVKVKNEQLKPR